MPQPNSDNEGRRPYRTYKARGARRTVRDEQLVGERSRPDSRQRGGGSKSYRTYGSSPDAEAHRTRGSSAKDASSARTANNQRERIRDSRKNVKMPTRHRRRIRWWHVPVTLLAVLAIAGVILTVLAWPGYQKFDRAVDKANERVDKKTRAQLSADDGWILRNGTTLLLLGVDMKVTDTTGRSDTIILMRFNPDTHTINQLSIPRDTRVEVPGHGYTKINEAMFWGGSSLAVKTVKDFTGIPINHVMVVTFQGFPRLVNAVGGVDMMVPETVTTEAGANHRTVVFEKGMHHFDGKYAMLYVRIRKAYADGDFTRVARQQAFVQALQKKIAQPSNLPKLPEIGTKFMSGVATDLTTNQILELAYLKWRAKGGKKLLMEGTPGWDQGVAYVFPPDAVARQRVIKRFLGN